MHPNAPDHLRRLLDCAHVTAAVYNESRYVRHVDADGRFADYTWQHESLADVSTLTYGRWDTDRDRECQKIDPSTWTVDTLPVDALAVIEYTVYSDYSGGTVERANEKAIREDYPNAEWLKELSGGHGTSGLAIDIRAWLDSLTDDDDPHALLEMIEGLEDYPLASEDAHSELEMELETEALPDVYKDLARTVDDSKYSRLHDYLSDLPADTAYACYRAAMEETNTYPEFESAVSCYVDIKRIRSVYLREAIARRHLSPEMAAAID